ncbi:hypothetical protein LguiB_009754 [Lonicera macranthoides]
MASSFKKFVECTNADFDKLANGLYVNYENELGKKVVDELSNIEGLDEENVIKAANIIIGDDPKDDPTLPHILLFINFYSHSSLSYYEEQIRPSKPTTAAFGVVSDDISDVGVDVGVVMTKIGNEVEGEVWRSE